MKPLTKGQKQWLWFLILGIGSLVATGLLSLLVKLVMNIF
tara:strand:- start:4798 stop:4917 length:120 start_codon:yes stop_codon:yes gene_type:complete